MGPVEVIDRVKGHGVALRLLGLLSFAPLTALMIPLILLAGIPLIACAVVLDMWRSTE